MRRGDIFWVDLEPAVGHEAGKIRPAVIVSSDVNNSTVDDLGRGLVTVVPLSSRVSRVYRHQVLLPRGGTGLRMVSKTQVEQMRAVSLERIKEHIGRVPPALLAQLDDTIRLHLAL